jgi:hypothetical protein
MTSFTFKEEHPISYLFKPSPVFKKLKERHKKWLTSQ